MSSFFKTLDNEKDVVSTRTLLHEAIPLTGTIVSGTYGVANIKDFAHGMFQSVYDYPFLSSSANHIFDITLGYASDSALVNTSNTQNSKKKNIYNQMAQVLMGYDHTGSILQFDEDGDITGGGVKLKECFFLNFSRLLVKDEIKKGTFSLELGINNAFTQNGAVHQKRIKIRDVSGSSGFKINSPAGEYGILFAETTRDGDATLSTALINSETITGNASVAATRPACGLIFYQAGVAVISGSVLSRASAGGILDNSDAVTLNMISTDGATGFNFITGSTIKVAADAIRNRIFNIQFNNTTELNSTIYFCRMNHNEFNYSTNPTYLNNGKIRVKTKSSDVPIAYVTSIGLYNSNNELMATAKLSEPLRKDPSQEFTIRCRLDF
tara:strand:+ start:3254 stop:4399 length:1146 start_codon:yes stop_codon:yes gene_type:complete